VLQDTDTAAADNLGLSASRDWRSLVDNLAARRAAASAHFDLLIDAGLGASAAEGFDLRMHAFPDRARASGRGRRSRPPSRSTTSSRRSTDA
jgi:hypothetical protein